MKKALALLACITVMHAISIAQFSTAEKIRSYYTKINTKVASAQKDKMSMYCNEVTVNKLGGSWPGVGNYQKHISLWYTGDPLSAGIDNPEDLLEKVNTSGESAGEKFTEEFLFYNGELLFYCYFDSYKYNDVAQRDEHRLYFSKGKLLKYDLKQGSRGVSAKAQKDIQADAVNHSKMMQALFLNSSEYSKEAVEIK